ncbi:hypothetical protein NOR_05448 [Metarhizium rileyi]|uniref:Transmembrane protein n=1 Tax=Metarhizium rileyi (strain RCEF 4871) TaxID=1649241 RepID=A0A167CMS6_METRR|nr:hypothetical protein NOR_05448 [Metarhizium rileyi RCEF 4871]
MTRGRVAQLAVAAALLFHFLGLAHGSTYKFCEESAEENRPVAVAARRDCSRLKLSGPQRCIYRPAGSRLTSVPVANSSGEELAVFLPERMDARAVEHALVVVAGKLSNAGVYWESLEEVVELYRMRTSRPRGSTISVAPLLFSQRYTPGLQGEKHLAWTSARAWISGGAASHPARSTTTSIDALEALVDDLSRRDKYPRLANITVVGQSAGGQLVQRFAALARERGPDGVHVRYVQNNPATCSYFTGHRSTPAAPSARTCRRYNAWPFGFDGFDGTAAGRLPPREYFRRYMSRDVVATVGYRDTNPCSGDQACQAVLQGGHRRRDRNLVWYRYVHELARTGEDLTGFPGSFAGLPDWGSGSGSGSVPNTSAGLRLAVARGAGHEFDDIFASPVGLSALFDHDHVLEGWRPGR